MQGGQNVQKCATMANFLKTSGLNYWETIEDRRIQRGGSQALNPLSNRVTFTTIVPGATPYGALNAGG